jgi:putative toxin-antitoxin system antitoxin component (TIGR02293 family)
MSPKPVRALSSTLDFVRRLEGRRGKSAKTYSGVIAIQPDSIPFTVVERLSAKLDITPAALLDLIGVPERTRARRKQEGFLKNDEADRLLRVVRVFEEAIRVFGTEPKAAGWLHYVSPPLGDVTALSLLDSDAGAQAVKDEIMRIDYGDTF